MDYPPDVSATRPPQCATCGTDAWVLCRRTCADGHTSYHWQCPYCGRTSTAVSHAVAAKARTTPDVDEELSGRYWANINAAKDTALAEWRKDYNEFLQSPRWHQQCKRVLDRDRGLCQCCLLYPATQVHHTEYPDGQLDVLLYTLQALCDDCHKRFSDTRWEGQ